VSATLTFRGSTVLGLTGLLFACTMFLLSLYSTVHWEISGGAAAVEVGVHHLVATKEMETGMANTATLQAMAKDVESRSASLHSAASGLLFKLESFRICAIATFLVSLLSVTARPRWLAFVSIPLGALAGYQALILM
jgi:hypothetical protein